MSTSLTVRHTRRGDGFVALPRNLADAILARTKKQAHGQTVLELSWTPPPTAAPPADEDAWVPGRAFVAWSGDLSTHTVSAPASHGSAPGSGLAPPVGSLVAAAVSSSSAPAPASVSGAALEIDAAFGSAIGLPNYAAVTVKVCKRVALATRVYIEPASFDDWDVVQLNAATLEATLLNHLAVVAPKQPIPLVVPPHAARVMVRVTRVEPDGERCVLLAPGCEVAIAPKVRSRDRAVVPPKARVLRTVAVRPLEHAHEIPRAWVSRADWDALTAHLYPDQLDAAVARGGPKGSVKVLAPPLLTPALERKAPLPADPDQATTVVQPPVAVQLALSDDVPAGLVCCVAPVLEALRAQLNRLDAELAGGVEAGAHGWKVKCVLAPAPAEEEEADAAPTSPFPAENPIPASDLPIDSPPPTPLGGTDAHLRTITSALNTTSRSRAFLIAGAAGTGKSALARAWLAAEAGNGGLLHTLYVPLDRFLGPYPADRQWAACQDLAAVISATAPAAVVLDNASAVVGTEGEGDVSAPDGVDKQGAVARMLVRALAPLMKAGAARVVLVATSAAGLHRVLKEEYWLGDSLVLGEGGREERLEILSALVDDESIDLDLIAGKTEGYTAQDLVHVLSRARHLALAADPAAPLRLTDTHLADALRDYVPANVASLKKSTAGKITPWSAIGGLDAAKQVLLETFAWPTQYPDLFAQVPLRLRSGVLLYGYPGCGKTVLAQAVAAECGLRLVGVKGPELLDKYIGASEAAVRNLFAQARAAAPCVLFFDEFEAIAPRRGSDNAGVTDRVVNQLLTELDGAEGLGKGVYVLGATSRPDLIDPALLRPGRLDKAVECGMPTRTERAAILEAVAGHAGTPIADDVDWDAVADATEGFSGADLQGVVSGASLEAVQDALQAATAAVDETAPSHSGVHVEFKASPGAEPLDARAVAAWVDESEVSADQDKDGEGKETTTTGVRIEVHHVMAALKSTRPSVAPDLRAKLARIYAMYSAGVTEVPKEQKLALK
ncbi:Peroxisome biosynthesis protein pex1 [Blastocladiella emersonii ATCC 22665]|nr:Peroxisome biosynthesis protein pex1 [Blastocladiella emersonii ATCC 22665]